MTNPWEELVPPFIISLVERFRWYAAGARTPPAGVLGQGHHASLLLARPLGHYLALGAAE